MHKHDQSKKLQPIHDGTKKRVLKRVVPDTKAQVEEFITDHERFMSKVVHSSKSPSPTMNPKPNPHRGSGSHHHLSSPVPGASVDRRGEESQRPGSSAQKYAAMFIKMHQRAEEVPPLQQFPLKLPPLHALISKAAPPKANAITQPPVSSGEQQQQMQPPPQAGGSTRTLSEFLRSERRSNVSPTSANQPPLHSNSSSPDRSVPSEARSDTNKSQPSHEARASRKDEEVSHAPNHREEVEVPRRQEQQHAVCGAPAAAVYDDEDDYSEDDVVDEVEHQPLPPKAKPPVASPCVSPARTQSVSPARADHVQFRKDEVNRVVQDELNERVVVDYQREVTVKHLMKRMHYAWSEEIERKVDAQDEVRLAIEHDENIAFRKFLRSFKEAVATISPTTSTPASSRSVVAAPPADAAPHSAVLQHAEVAAPTQESAPSATHLDGVGAEPAVKQNAPVDAAPTAVAVDDSVVVAAPPHVDEVGAEPTVIQNAHADDVAPAAQPEYDDAGVVGAVVMLEVSESLFRQWIAAAADYRQGELVVTSAPWSNQLVASGAHVSTAGGAAAVAPSTTAAEEARTKDERVEEISAIRPLLHQTRPLHEQESDLRAAEKLRRSLIEESSDTIAASLHLVLKRELQMTSLFVQEHVWRAFLFKATSRAFFTLRHAFASMLGTADDDCEDEEEVQMVETSDLFAVREEIRRNWASFEEAKHRQRIVHLFRYLVEELSPASAGASPDDVVHSEGIRRGYITDAERKEFRVLQTASTRLNGAGSSDDDEQAEESAGGDIESALFLTVQQESVKRSWIESCAEYERPKSVKYEL